MTTVVSVTCVFETYPASFRWDNGEFCLMDNRPTVVFADDNPKVVGVVCDLLKAAYRVVKVAADGEQALRAVCELIPDFAILDISMPKLDGFKVARQIKKAGLSTRVLFVTLINDDDYREEAKSAGYGYVLKYRLSLDLLEALSSAREGSFFCSR